MVNATIGQQLLDLKERSGLSLANIARGGGYKNASSIQRYFDAAYEAEYLPRALAKRLKDALIGFGEPVIQDADIERLTEFGFQYERKLFHLPEAALQRRPTYSIDCNPTYPSGDYLDEAEIFSIGEDPLKAFEKHDQLSARPIDACYVSTNSLSPRYRIGEVIFFERERPAAVGGDVIAILAQDDDGLASAILATLVSQSRTAVELEILTPPGRITVDRQKLDVIYPVLIASELLPEKNPRDHTRTS
jgi:hypothetical protein